MTELNLELYKKLYRIRKAETTIQDHYFEDEMKTPMHMSMGEEAIAVGVCHALTKEDQVFCSYRSHAVYLAKTESTVDFFAEMYGRDTALLKGKGGSMHVIAPEYGFMGTSAIVAGIIPVAVGAAFTNKYKGNGKITAVFFGDGAIDEGDFWESLNIACLKELPILFVNEDNGLAVHTPPSIRHGYDSILDIVSQYRCNILHSDTTDAEEIYNLACTAKELVKKNGMPCFLQLKYYRYLEHVGTLEDFDAGYRPREEFQEWYEKDPVHTAREKLLGHHNVSQNQLVDIEREIDKEIDESLKAAMNAPFPDAGELYTHVYAD